MRRRRAPPRGSASIKDVKKVIREILILVWRVVRTYLWKWVKPRLRRWAFMAVAAIAIIGVLSMLVANSCGG